MPDLSMSIGVRRRERGSLRPSELFNMYLERDETSPDGYARQSRQGLGTRSTIGAGPINGLFARRGVFDEDLFGVSESALYRETDSLGAIDGTGPASFAASGIELVVTRGASAWSYNGTNLAAIAFPDGSDVAAVAFLGGYFIFVKAGTGRIYWSTSMDARTIDGLDFATAESEPDELLDVYVVNDSLWLLGQSSVEAWQLTGDADAPIARIEGLLLKKGIISTGAAAELDNTLFWWGNDDMIYRGGQGVPQRVSDHTIEERLKGSEQKEVFSFTYEGHAFLCVRTDDGTFVLDVSHPNGVWSEFASYDRNNWRAIHSATPAGNLVFGSDDDGRILEFVDDNWDDGDHLERKMSAFLGGSGPPVPVHKLCLVCNSGDTALLTGQGAEPVVELRASRDNGKRWGDWRQVRLGQRGKYRQHIEKRRWGVYDRHGGCFEIRVVDPVPFRVSRVFANEPSGGRENR